MKFPAAKQSRITGAVALTLAQGVVLLLGYITHPLIGRFLGPASYGIYGLVLSIQSILGLFLTMGVPVAVARFVAQNEGYEQSILRRGLRMQTLVALGVAAVTILFSPLIARALRDTSLIPFIIFIAAVMFLQAFYPVYIQFLSGLHRFNRQAIIMTAYAAIKLAGALGLLFVFQIYGALAGFAVGGIVAGLLGYAWTRRAGGTKPLLISPREFLAFAGVYTLTLAGLQLLISLDLFMVKAFLGDNIATGYYNAAVTLSRIPYMLLQALAFILLPSVSALTKPGASHTEAAVFIRDALRYLIALIVPGVALAAATSENLVILFFSSEYIPAAPALSILMVGLGSLAFYLLLSNIVAGAGRARVSLGLTAGLLVVSAVLGTILVPRYQLLGAAWQTTLTSLLGLVLIAGYTFRTFRIPVPIRSILNVLIASAAAVSVTYVWEASSLLLLPQYAIILLIYVGVLLLLREITVADRERLSRIHPLFRRLPAA